MPDFRPTELTIIAMYALPVVVWIWLYRQGAETRDLMFWSIIIFVIPIFGPVAAFVFYPRRDKDKRA